VDDDEMSSVWDDEFKNFLKLWFTGLMNSIEKLENDSWPNILEMTGRACAHVHDGNSFKVAWEKTKDIDDFIIEMNNSDSEKVFKKIDSNTLSITYTRCTCPLVQAGLTNSPILCNCSPNWIIENFEPLIEKTVDVTTVQTILRGSTDCRFIVSNLIK